MADHFFLAVLWEPCYGVVSVFLKEKGVVLDDDTTVMFQDGADSC